MAKKKVVIPKIEETTEYDGCLEDLNREDVTYVPATLAEFGLAEEKEVLENYRKQFIKDSWKGMPEFVNNDNLPYKSIKISFRNEEDYQEFAKLIEQNLTEKTKSIWYPKLEIDDNMLKRWIEECPEE